MRHITDRGAVALLARLDAAQLAPDRGQTAAVSILQSFIYAVNARAGNTIDQEHAKHMMMHAERVIAAIGV